MRSDTMAEAANVQRMLESLALQTRHQVIREIEAFANDYHHHVDGRDVVIVDQLLDFLRGVQRDSE